MLPLRDLQSRFAQALHQDGAGSDAGVHGRGLSAGQRLQIYRNHTRIALVNALRAVYPVTERLLGEEFFEAAAREYVRRHPSRSGNIQEYGGAFPAFLSEHRRDVMPAYIPDVAALEWRRVETATAPPHTPMDTAALGKVPPEIQPDLHFRHQPAARAFSSRFPVLTIWKFCQAPEPQDELDISGPGECVLFARPALDVYMRLLTPGEYRFLQSLCRGDTFESACRAALETEPAFDVAANFAELVREEILTGFYL